ncbi:MAG: aminotransferase class V-fold PLP-dependent enzyme, partial [Spirochaetaceae bacterium]|nr:aminotransferase class V-fold PLP-dependent enzyme [Spirochaetaceae bacterium]
REIVRERVGAGEGDSLFFAGFGMTAAINKLQRILGLRLPEGRAKAGGEGTRPLVLITHMEHHSNQITWEECGVDVRIIPRDEETGLPDLEWQERMLKESVGKRLLIGAFTACSNVTGILTPYRRMAALMHRYGGLCFIDFAASAPYVEIDMHPSDPEERLDAIVFSPHKFLGGPGASGVLVLSNALYRIAVPDQPGGGTVKWTTPFGTHRYVDEIEAREDGGTPGFLQAIRAALAMELKRSMGTERIAEREEELKRIAFEEFKAEGSVMLLEGGNLRRLGILSFYAPGEHHNLIVRLLNDRFGIQARGGCSCAGTYGHILFNIKKTTSRHITDMIDAGDLSEKPGWVRVSLHPTMTDDEARFIGRSVVEVIRNYRDWGLLYEFHKESGEFIPKDGETEAPDLLSRFRAI